MSNYFDDDTFWDGPNLDPDRTSQIERVRRRSPERTRTHHVVRREEPLDQLDDGSSMWIEPAPRIARRLGPLGAVDPRVLSIGAVAMAVVLAVPLFGALGDSGNGDDLRAIDEQSTTTVARTEHERRRRRSSSRPLSTPTTSSDADVAESSPDAESSSDEESRSGDGDAAPAAQALSASPDCANQYTAAAGDYWLRIADGSGTSLDSLLDVNEATAETPIYPGSTICLPEDAAAPAGFAGSNDGGSSGTPAAVAAAETAPCANLYEIGGR